MDFNQLTQYFVLDNGGKKELYLDAYKKLENRYIKVEG